MEPQPLEQVARNIDERLGRVEQILPKLATKDELKTTVAGAIAPLATKDDMRTAIADAVAPLATKEGLRTAIANAIAPLATKEELGTAIANAIAPLATKAELADAIAPLATKVEVRDEGERTRLHFDVVAEGLTSQIALVAEGQIALGERMDRGFTNVHGELSQLDRRVTRLEAGRRRRT